MMKKYLALLFLIFSASLAAAQTQQGIVRTIGTSSHHGVPVAGATIKVKGNTQQYLSEKKGNFSLPMHNSHEGDKFQLLNVTKRGYELADKDFLSKTFAYSSQSLLEIVLLSTEEMEKEKQAIEDRVFKIAKENYEKKLDGLKQEQEQGLITLEDYRTKLKTLQDQYDTFDEILSAMAEHYARTDYDRLDSLDVLINTHIINGELDEAYMLVAQKGNLDDRIAAYQRHAATNAAAQEMLDKLTDELSEQHLAYEKERDDIANDLYNKHSIAISRLDFDQALEMLKLRADLDTTNVAAVFDYAYFCLNQKLFADCEKYHLVCLHVSVLHNDVINTPIIQNNLGILYCKIHDYENSLKYFKLALDSFEQLPKEITDAYRTDIATAQNNLGNLYYDLHDYATSERYYKFALETYKQLFNQNPDAYREGLARTLLNLGNLYIDLKDYANSEKYYKLALENYEQLFNQNPDANRTYLVTTQNALGIMYNALHNFATSEKYYKLALENNEQLHNQNPNEYKVNLAMTQNNLGRLYSTLNDYATSEKYYKLSLENYEQLFNQYPEAYRADLARVQYNLGSLYDNLHDYTNSEKYYLIALANRENLFKKNQDIYRTDLAMTQNNLGSLYDNLHDYTNSEKFYSLALENYKQLFNQNPDVYITDLASTYLNFILLYADLNDMEQQEKYIDQALELYSRLFILQPDLYKDIFILLQNTKVRQLTEKGYVKEALKLVEETYAMDKANETCKFYLAVCHNLMAYEYAKESDYTNAILAIDKALAMAPSEPGFYDTKGEILLLLGRNDEALEMWYKVLELDPNVLDNYPDGTNLSNGLKKLGLIE